MTLFAAVLLSAALVFFIHARSIQRTTALGDSSAFTSGDTVRVTEVVDGDDIVAQRSDGSRARIRIIGVDAFNASVSDPTLLEYGRICMRHLQSQILEKDVRLRIPERRTGNSGRLLATVYVTTEEGTLERDIGLELIKKGYALTFTRYEFADEASYLDAERQARAQKTGFWSDPVVTSRAMALKALWREERASDD